MARDADGEYDRKDCERKPLTYITGKDGGGQSGGRRFRWVASAHTDEQPSGGIWWWWREVWIETQRTEQRILAIDKEGDGGEGYEVGRGIGVYQGEWIV